MSFILSWQTKPNNKKTEKYVTESWQSIKND